QIHAVAVKGDAISENGAAAGYVVYPNAPSFNPVAGAVKEGTKVAIKCVPDSADIYYTTDGTTPTMEESPKYTGPIEITKAMTIKAISVLGQYQASSEAAYTIKVDDGALAKPTFSQPTNSTLIYGTKVTLSTTETGEDVSIRYTFGAAPADPTLEKGTTYTDPISIRKNQTIKAITVKGEEMSEVETATYTVKLSDLSFEQAADEAIKQGTKITCTLPNELPFDKDLYILYVVGDDETTELETESDILDRVSLSAQYSRYGNAIYPSLGVNYKIACYSQDLEEWCFPITAPNEDGTFKIRARMVIDGSGSGDLVYSDPKTETYTVSGEGEIGDDEDDMTPVFSESDGALAAGTEVTITAEGADAIFYVIDGDEADLTYDGFRKFKCFIYDHPIKIYKGQTIKAVGGKVTGMSGELPVFGKYSQMVSATYTVNGGDQLDRFPTLTLNPASVRVARGEAVTFICTMNPKKCEDSMGFAIRSTMQGVQGIEKLEYRLHEDSAWMEYAESVMANLDAAHPVAAIPNNTDFEEDARVCDTAKGVRTVYYRMTIAEDAEEAPVMAFEIGYAKDNKYLTTDANNYAPLARVPLAIEIYTKPKAPVFTPDGGEVEAEDTITLTTTTSEAKIYYGKGATASFVSITTKEALDEAAKADENNAVMLYNDTAKSSLAELNVSTPGAKCSISAAAVLIEADGSLTWSDVTTREFTIKGEDPVDPSANEDNELTGVSVYPNPNAGTFNVAVPESARVEIFGLNGAMMMSREVNAGTETFSIDHSGIYFVRVMAGNKTAVKRVVVR
ncbi:MAG: chitobiase/beta-hexosaminidase C-terminal domain-containing protein, partial [Bacteroidales bacterium]|nr:chitobiase/beta-hexosaminidase C-terminal domain-containing protein [Bacteroidales bacterium]